MTVMLLALAGGLGAVTRFLLDCAVRSAWRTSFPWATLGINISGSALLGVVAGIVMLHDGSTVLQTVIGTGFCGGYTTFSTAAVDTLRLAQADERGRALAVALGTAALSVGACVAGFAVAGIL